MGHVEQAYRNISTQKHLKEYGYSKRKRVEKRGFQTFGPRFSKKNFIKFSSLSFCKNGYDSCFSSIFTHYSKFLENQTLLWAS